MDRMMLKKWMVLGAAALMLCGSRTLPGLRAEEKTKTAAAGAAAPLSAAGAAAVKSGAAAASGKTASPDSGGAIGPVPVQKGISVALMVNAGDFALVAQQAAQAEARILGLRYRWMGHVAEADQAGFIARAVKNGYKALVITPPAKSPLLAEEVRTALKSAMEAGVTVIAWDVDPGVDARSIFVSKGSAVRLGAFLVSMAAGELKAGKPPVKKVAFFYDSPDSAEVNSWVTEAKRRVLAEHNNWDIVATQYGYGNINTSAEIASSIFTTYKDLDVLICPSQTALLGAARAAEKLGKAGDVAIVGFSAPKAAGRYIVNGTIDSCGLWDAAAEMRIALYMAAEIVSGASFRVGDELSVPGLEYKPRIEANPTRKFGDPSQNSGMVVPDRILFSPDTVGSYKF